MPYELDADDEDLLRQLAEHTGESLSAALRRALAERLARLRTGGVAAAAASDDPSTASEPTTGPAFVLRLFGHPLVRRIDAGGDGQEATWRLRRAFVLLAYVALAPRHRAAKEELIEALWPDASAAAVARNFHPTVSDARRALAGGARDLPNLAHRDGVYLLDPAMVWWIDVDRWRGLVEAARRLAEQADDEAELACLEAAWSLYRGPLLSGFDAEWIEVRRDELHRSWLQVLDRLGVVAARLGRDPLALDAWRRLLMEEPFEERVHLEVMELYARRGRRDLLRRQYVKLQELLAELDVEPAAATQARYLELMRAPAAGAPIAG